MNVKLSTQKYDVTFTAIEIGLTTTVVLAFVLLCLWFKCRKKKKSRRNSAVKTKSKTRYSPLSQVDPDRFEKPSSQLSRFQGSHALTIKRPSINRHPRSIVEAVLEAVTSTNDSPKSQPGGNLSSMLKNKGKIKKGSQKGTTPKKKKWSFNCKSKSQTLSDGEDDDSVQTSDKNSNCKVNTSLFSSPNQDDNKKPGNIKDKSDDSQSKNEMGCRASYEKFPDPGEELLKVGGQTSEFTNQRTQNHSYHQRIADTGQQVSDLPENGRNNPKSSRKQKKTSSSRAKSDKQPHGIRNKADNENQLSQFPAKSNQHENQVSQSLAEFKQYENQPSQLRTENNQHGKFQFSTDSNQPYQNISNHEAENTPQLPTKSNRHGNQAFQFPSESNRHGNQAFQFPSESNRHGNQASQFPTESNRHGNQASQFLTESNRHGNQASQFPTESSRHGNQASQFPVESSRHENQASQFPTKSSRHGNQASQFPTKSNQYENQLNQFPAESSRPYENVLDHEIENMPQNLSNHEYQSTSRPEDIAIEFYEHPQRKEGWDKETKKTHTKENQNPQEQLPDSTSRQQPNAASGIGSSSDSCYKNEISIKTSACSSPRPTYENIPDQNKKGTSPAYENIPDDTRNVLPRRVFEQHTKIQKHDKCYDRSFSSPAGAGTNLLSEHISPTKSADILNSSRVPELPRKQPATNPPVGVSQSYAINEYAELEWRGPTEKAKKIRKGYNEIRNLSGCEYLRRIRGDNYCALRAALFQALSEGVDILTRWQREPNITEMPRKLLETTGFEWINGWSFADRLELINNSTCDTLVDCLHCLLQVVIKARHQATDFERCNYILEIFNDDTNDMEIKIFEAVKFLMLVNSIKLYDAMNGGQETCIFPMLLFARDSSPNPKSFMYLHLNTVGKSGGLDQVEMCLLGHTINITLKVARLAEVDEHDFIVQYPDDTQDAAAEIWLVAEDDRHYNVISEIS